MCLQYSSPELTNQTLALQSAFRLFVSLRNHFFHVWKGEGEMGIHLAAIHTLSAAVDATESYILVL